ncbi:hypothetical protein APS_2017 [Acetobacter pasteurianus subsp. pasteurianus LMG 1262 = NBRC 106471]|nr:hypothetical protein APS_2017 [Acetobacter pasteurianus subsp. pasteurianus LMG 1262 = NBRC 106471]
MRRAVQFHTIIPETSDLSVNIDYAHGINVLMLDIYFPPPPF